MADNPNKWCESKCSCGAACAKNDGHNGDCKCFTHL